MTLDWQYKISSLNQERIVPSRHVHCDEEQLQLAIFNATNHQDEEVNIQQQHRQNFKSSPSAVPQIRETISEDSYMKHAGSTQSGVCFHGAR